LVDLPRSEEGDSFVGEIKVSIIRGSMHNFALEFIDPGDVWPFPVVQNTLGIDEKVTPIVDDVAGLEIGDLDVPLAFDVVPFSARDTFVELAVFAEIIFLGEAEEILVDLVRTYVGRRPVGIGFERQGVRMGGDITSTARKTNMLVILNGEKRSSSEPWIFVLEPRSTDVVILFVEDELKVLEGPL